jgi:hypothetical protein
MKRAWTGFGPFAMVFMWAFGFVCGYHWPRDVEIESTKPIELHYEITEEAARLLIFKGAEGLRAEP